MRYTIVQSKAGTLVRDERTGFMVFGPGDETSAKRVAAQFNIAEQRKAERTAHSFAGVRANEKKESA